MPKTYSALTSDIERDPDILEGMKLEAYLTSPFPPNRDRERDVKVTVSGAVTTVELVR